MRREMAAAAADQFWRRLSLICFLFLSALFLNKSKNVYTKSEAAFLMSFYVICFVLIWI